MTHPFRTNLAIFIGVLAALSSSAAEEKNSFHANIVLYVQDGNPVPDGYQVRLHSLGLRAEAFFAKWMEHWKSPIERSQIFARDEEGKIKVILVHGKCSILVEAAPRYPACERKRSSQQRSSFRSTEKAQ